MANSNNKILRIVGLLSILVLAYFYRSYNPSEHNIFPSCPFRELTGYQCAGCGSQRAVHHLLHFDFAAAFHENALLVIAIPYILLGWIIEIPKKASPFILKIRKNLYGIKAIYFSLGIIIAWWVLRNISF